EVSVRARGVSDSVSVRLGVFQYDKGGAETSFGDRVLGDFVTLSPGEEKIVTIQAPVAASADGFRWLLYIADAVGSYSAGNVVEVHEARVSPPGTPYLDDL